MTRGFLRRALVTAPALTLVAACSDSSGTGPSYGPPEILQVNGVTKPTGIPGMTVVIEGTSLAEARYGSVYFLGTDGAPIAATVAAADWTNSAIVTTVPQGTAAASKLWVTTNWGTTDTLDFALVSGNTFSPSNISWARTTDLPQPLQGLGAAFVPVEHGSEGAKYLFALGGAADLTNLATSTVSRARVDETGAVGAWDQSMTRLPATRAYHATAAATAYTAKLDTTAAGYLYVVGGIDSTGATVNSVLAARVGLDGTVGPWSPATPLPAALHSATAVVYRSYLYVAGGADPANVPTTAARRAAVRADGTLGAWEAIAALPAATAHHSLANFGPYLYLVGGDTAAVSPSLNGASGTETSASYVARIDMRDGKVPAWTPTNSPGKARSKHGMMSAGGSVVITSGIYSGQAGSSENSYATINADGTLASWGGATGSSTIAAVLGYSVYNQAAVSFVDGTGKGHVIVLGGASRTTTGRASAGVVYY